ncbi:hypothetical protein ACFE04_007926 [Oxalis oulophora]
MPLQYADFGNLLSSFLSAYPSSLYFSKLHVLIIVLRSIVCEDDSSEGYQAMDVGSNKGFGATNAILGWILDAPELHDTMPDDKKVAAVGAIVAQLLYLDAIDPNKSFVVSLLFVYLVHVVCSVFMPGDLLCSVYAW